MLISFSHKFITIAIPKTGTRSLRGCLTMNNQFHDGQSDNRLVDVIATQYSRVFKRHGTLTEHMKDAENVGLDISLYFTFAFVRNPWSRYVSYILWAKDKPEFIKKGRRTMSLELAIDRQRIQYDYIYDKESGKTVDYIARFENYQAELMKISDKLNLNLDAKNIPHLNKNKKYDYKDFYTKELIDKVYEKEHKIIDLMGYSYDE